MAFQPTKQRKFGVSPVNVSGSTGYRNMANAFLNVGKAFNQVAQAKRETDFSNAMLDAETAGMSAVKRDEKTGNLIPINNLDWDSGLTFTEDRNRVEEAYRKTAITAYSTALKNDANEFAGKLYAENFQKPDAIKAARDAFMLKQKQELPPEVYNNIEAHIESSFIEIINQARMNKINFERESAKSEALTLINTLTNKASAIFENNASIGVNTTQDQGSQTRLAEIYNEFDDARKLLEFAGMPKADIDNLLNASKQEINTRLASSYIKKFFKDSGEDIPKSFEEIYKFVTSIKSDEKFASFMDGEKLETAMEQSLQEIINISNATKTADRQAQEGTFWSALLDISLGSQGPNKIKGLADIYKIRTPDNKPLEDEFLQRLVNAWGDPTGKTSKKEDTVAADILQNETASLLGKYEHDPKNAALYTNQIVENLAKLEAGTRSGRDGNWDYGEKSAKFFSIQKKKWIEEFKTSTANEITKIKIAMANNDFSYTPGFFHERLEPLKEAGIVGYGKGAIMDEIDYMSLVTTYSKKYNEHLDKIRIEKRVLYNAKMGNSNQVDDLKAIGRYPEQVVVNGQNYDLDIFHADKAIRDASMEAVINFSVQYNTIHDQLDALRNFENIDDEATFRQLLSAYNNIISGQKAKTKNPLNDSVRYTQAIAHMENNGINTALLEYARVVPFNVAREAFSVMRKDDANRKKNAIVPQGEDPQIYWKNLMPKAVDDKTWLAWIIEGLRLWKDSGINDDLSKQQRAMIDTFKEQSGGIDLGSAIFDQNPALFDFMVKTIESKIIHGQAVNDAQGHQAAIISTLGEIGTNIGFTEDFDGTVRLEMFPYLATFQAKVDKVAPGLVLQRSDIMKNIFDMFNRLNDINGIGWEEKDKQNFMNKQYILEANQGFGEEPDYKVWMETGDGNRILILNNYSYQYKHSNDEKAYKKGIKRLEDIKNNHNIDPTTFAYMQKIWTMIPGMDEVVQKRLIRKYQNIGALETQKTVMELFNLYNKAGAFLSPYGFEPIPPDTIIKHEDAWQDMFSALLTLGIDY